MSEHHFQNHHPVAFLNCKFAFNSLTAKEKFYAHYLSRASWYGGLIVLVQTSLESPLIFSLLFKLFQAQTVEELKKIAIQDCQLTEEEYTAVLVYTSGIFSNMGNYKSCGGKKFIPNVSKEKFEKLIRASKAAQANSQQINSLCMKCLEPMYSLGDKEKQLGFPSIGTTTYMSKNFSEKDEEIVKQFLLNQNIDANNSRSFKTMDSSGRTSYEIRLASVLQTDNEEEKISACNDSENNCFTVTRGDYSKLLEIVNENLALAKDNAANENEEKMLEHYIKSFQTGSLDSHQDGSCYWIKNKEPIIENFIGFIETYRDPARIRGEFEGFVAMVNKARRVKFAELVSAAPKLLSLLPFSVEYQILEEFLHSDFTSLDVLTKSGSSVYAGICLPYYDEIVQSEGFVNVSLHNVISESTKRNVNYLEKADQELFHEELMTEALEIQIGLHELFGLKCGRLFQKQNLSTSNHKTDEIVHHEASEKLFSSFEEGNMYDSFVDSLGLSYEKCQADCVAMYLSTESEVLKIFKLEGLKADAVVYIIWLLSCLHGIDALQHYDPETKSWLQAHSQGAFVILQVLLEFGGDFVNIQEVKGSDGEPDLLLTLDRDQILAVGKFIIGSFLKKLQLYQSTIDVISAKSMFAKYSAVKYPFLKYREIVKARKKPKVMLVQANTILKDGDVYLCSYEPNHKGLIQSWIDRFQEVDVTTILEELWENDRTHFI